MRRVFGLGLLVLTILTMSLGTTGLARGSTQRQTFATNTPAASPFAFATNTPSGPTNTPTLTPPPSSTPTDMPTVTPSPTATFTPTSTDTPTDTPSPTPTPNGPFSYPEGVNPLTGQPYPDEAAMARRNLIVKISNYPPVVRPQTGINSADVVFEYEAEGGVTRFAAIFRSKNPDHIGSVRSARLLDLQLVVMYNALLAYSGTSEPIQNLIMSSDWVYQAFSPLKGDNCEEAGFCRFPKDGLPFEHTLFLDTNALWDLATNRNVNTGYRARGFAFGDQADSGGLPANDLYIDWWGQTDSRWQYDPDTGRYLRYTDGVPHIDLGDDQQLWTDNLIIIEVPHDDHPTIFPAGASYTSIDIQLVDQGRAYLVRDGQVFQGYWRRQDTEPGSALQIIYGNNTPIMMKPGRTWVSVVRGLSEVAISEEYADMNATATAIALTATPTIDPAAVDTGD
jgi:hypothetical protein